MLDLIRVIVIPIKIVIRNPFVLALPTVILGTFSFLLTVHTIPPILAHYVGEKSSHAILQSTPYILLLALLPILLASAVTPCKIVSENASLRMGDLICGLYKQIKLLYRNFFTVTALKLTSAIIIILLLLAGVQLLSLIRPQFLDQFWQTIALGLVIVAATAPIIWRFIIAATLITDQKHAYDDISHDVTKVICGSLFALTILTLITFLMGITILKACTLYTTFSNFTNFSIALIVSIWYGLSSISGCALLTTEKLHQDHSEVVRRLVPNNNASETISANGSETRASILWSESTRETVKLTRENVDLLAGQNKKRPDWNS